MTVRHNTECGKWFARGNRRHTRRIEAVGRDASCQDSMPRDDAEAKLCSMNSHLRGWISLLNTWLWAMGQHRLPSVLAVLVEGLYRSRKCSRPSARHTTTDPPHANACVERRTAARLDRTWPTSDGTPSEVGLTGRLRLRRLLRVGLFTIEEERLRCLHAVRGPTQA